MKRGSLRIAATCVANILLLLAGIGGCLAEHAQVSAAPIVIDATGPAPAPSALPFAVGGRSPAGHTLAANDRYLLLDGKPWFPIIGEFHYTRYPEKDWERELLKIKAAGIQVISTYVFWIHHEEIEGEFNWKGQRDLRRFIELCGKNGLYVWVRVGPWDHGEVRNGGLPDWLIAKTPTRENNPVYLDHVRRFWGEISKQVQGLFWKDGGPIVGIQLENEYSARGAGKGAEHILELHRIARQAGLDAPFYTITGWDNAVIPPRDVLPVFGGYADGFWWRTLTELPPNSNYFFTKIRCEENVGDDLHSKHTEIDLQDSHYPYLTAEMGGGMAVAYHRRPALTADDTAAMQVAKLGSGVVGYGYYMFHGGTNPDGARTTLQESQATGYINDLPVKSYDFQAPLGEFGQMHPSYRVLKTLNLFLSDFGGTLAPMTPYFPDRRPAGKQDTATPRVAARVLQDRGFIFINNHRRVTQLPPRDNFQVQIKLAAGAVQIPRSPTQIPSDAYTIWPVNLDLGPVTLKYATAQLLCKLDEPRTYVFFAWPGIAPEFAFEDKEGVSIENFAGRLTREGGQVYIDHLVPGTQFSIRVTDRSGNSVNILLLSREQALNLWKAKVAGKERLIFSPAEVYFANEQAHVVAFDPASLKAGFFPALEQPPVDAADGADGIFNSYSVNASNDAVTVEYRKVRDAGAVPPLKIKNEVALVPDDPSFSDAAMWAMNVHRVNPKSSTRVFLKINYLGDIARLYVDDVLLTDNFYNGTQWWVGMDRVPEESWNRLQLKILPLGQHAPIYLPAGARPASSAGDSVVQLMGIEAMAEYDRVIESKP